MARISEQTIEKVRSSSDIVEVVQGYVQIKQRGRNFFGVCPFHNEKTPSFSVNPDKQIFKCFGCGIGGGVINFIMEIEKLEFKDSIIFLAEHSGIEIELDESYKGSNDLTQQLFKIHDESNGIFTSNFNTDKGKLIYKHLLERGLTAETIKTFNLGYSINVKDQVLRHCQNKEYTSDALKKSGLFVEIKQGYIDRFKGRIIFPIHNPTGKIIAFSGRAIDNDKIAKYVNSPETPIYHKSNILYGLHESKHHIRTLKSVVVVEGYFDYLQLFQSGIKNIVAISGTAFTEKHAQLLRRYTNNIFLAYDGDSAGVSAAIKAGYILLKYGHNPKIANIPKDVDPDDWVLKEGPEPFKKSLQESSDIIDFHIRNSQFDTTTESGKFNFIEESLNEISQIKDAVYRELQVKSLSSISNVSESSIIEKLTGIINNKNRYNKKSETQPKSRLEESVNLLNEELIKLCFVKSVKVRALIFDNLNKKWITIEKIRELYDIIYIHLKSNHPPNPSIILNEVKDSEERGFLSGLLIDVEDIEDDAELMAIECLTRLEENFLKNKRHILREKLKSDSDNDLNQIIKDISDIENQLKKIITKYDCNQ
tara:strand:- start:3137 stop:4915 length:1779 start_codon:yes stop_codon:yes gene_type:complete